MVAVIRSFQFQSVAPRAELSVPARLSSGWLAWAQNLFRKTDNQAGGRGQTLRRQVKFLARCALHASALRATSDALDQAGLADLAQSHPQWLLRPMRSYVRRGLPASSRAACVASHFGWMAAHLHASALQSLYSGASLPLQPGTAVLPAPELGLALRASSLREGELELHLQWKGHSVMMLVFSVLQARLVTTPDKTGRAAQVGKATDLSSLRLVVGGLQGVRGNDVALRELSAACQRLRPAALLVVALQGLSLGWGLQPAWCISAQSHVYAGYASRKRKVRLDYDAQWHDSGGERCDAHYWQLPPQPELRPDSEVDSKRRAQHRRRNALRDDLRAAVQAAAGRLTAQTSHGITLRL